MELIGSDVIRTLNQATIVQLTATQFAILELRFRPVQDKLDAEVALYDADSQPVGGAFWVSIEHESGSLMQMKTADILALVKTKIQEMAI